MVDFSRVSTEHVLHAVAEYDRIGQDEFLTTHGFGRSRGYELLVNGQTYDSKAILGVAQRYATGTPVSRSQFSGGKFGAARVLEDLGFEVTRPSETAPEVIPATGSWRDVSSVGIDVARDEWNESGRTILLDIARRYHAVITYGEFAAEVERQTGIRTRQVLPQWSLPVLKRIAVECSESGEPNLSALVVDRNGRVGDGYAGAVEQATGIAPSDPEAHAASERLACYRYFEAIDLPADGGVPAPVPPGANRRTTARPKRTRAKPPPEPSLCPHCFIALPASGQCDHCR